MHQQDRICTIIEEVLKRYILLLFVVIAHLDSYAILRERVEVIDELRRFSGNAYKFYSIFPQEKIFLKFDNTAYFQGETVWFKGYVANASDLKRSER